MGFPKFSSDEGKAGRKKQRTSGYFGLSDVNTVSPVTESVAISEDMTSM